MQVAHRKSIRLIKWTMAAALALPLIFFSYAGWLSLVDIRSTADREIERTLDIAHEHALKVFETINLSLSETEEAVRDLTDDQIRAGQPGIYQRLNRLAEVLPQVKSVWLFDRSGRVLVNSLDPSPTMTDFSDRDYFNVHVHRYDQAPFVGRVLFPRAPYTGAPFFSVSRRRTSKEFTGVVHASVLPEYFETFYARVAQDKDSFFALGLADGNILARFPAATGTIQVSPQDPAGRAISKSPSAGIVTTTTPSDGVERRLAYRRLGGYPVYVAAGLSTSAIRARWLATLRNYLVIGLPLTISTFALLVFALRRTEQLFLEGARRQQAEEHLRRGQKLEALGHLTSGVAHDFNNLLMVINSSADLLRKDNLSSDRRLKYANAISDTVQRASVLTERLLTFARNQPAMTSTVDVADVLKSISTIIRTLCGSRIDCRIPAQPLSFRVCVDVSQFETAIVNLVANARDAISGYGTLTISIEEASSEGLPAEMDRSGRAVKISVCDTGSGISPDNLQRIFEPFFTTKDVGKGTGLGLSQVFGFARRSGGHVIAESTLGEGSVFNLFLPVVI